MADTIKEVYYNADRPNLSVIYVEEKQLTYVNDFVQSVKISGDMAQAYRTCEVTMLNAINGRNRRVIFEIGKRFKIFMGKVELFQGYLFRTSISNDGTEVLTLYDANYYLTQNRDSLKFKSKKASEIVKELCSKFGIATGTIEDTGTVLPSLILRDRTIYEMMIIALTESRKKDDRKFALHSKGGILHLLEQKKQVTTLMVDSWRNVIDANYTTSIEDTRTQVKVTGGDEEAPISTVVTNTTARSRYGTMQHYEHDSDLKDASKVADLARKLLDKMSKPTETFDVEVLGLHTAISGTAITANITMTGTTGAFYIVSDTHEFASDGHHIMRLGLSRTYDLPAIDYEAPENKDTAAAEFESLADTSNGKAKVNDLVLKWRPTVKKYAEQYGIPQFTELLLAMMMQESGGRHADLYQSSESLGLKRNTLKYEDSIKQGVKYFAEGLKKAKGDVKIALQAYNYGHGFINYALKRGGYSKSVAKDFSLAMQKKNKSNGYGDPNYVDHVLRYYTESDGSSTSNDSKAAKDDTAPNSFQKPCLGTVTSEYKTPSRPTHYGIDIAKSGVVSIEAAAKGTVSRSYVSSTYGETVMIKHKINGQDFETVYAHMRTGSRKVKVGDSVSKGQVIGTMGNTGRSFGQHLHFEIHKGSWNTSKTNAVNPMKYIDFSNNRGR